MQTDALPDHETCEAAVKAGRATALQRFIADNEPAGSTAEAEFRRQLAEVVAEVVAEARRQGAGAAAGF